MTITITTDMLFPLVLLGIAIFMIFVSSNFFFYYKGLKSQGALAPAPDPTPAEYEQAEDLINHMDIEVVAFLDDHTGPISITAPIATIPSNFSQDRIDSLELQVASLRDALVHANKLRMRYLKLLRIERELLRAILSGKDVKFPTYWRKYISKSFDNLIPTTGSLRIL